MTKENLTPIDRFRLPKIDLSDIAVPRLPKELEEPLGRKDRTGPAEPVQPIRFPIVPIKKSEMSTYNPSGEHYDI